MDERIQICSEGGKRGEGWDGRFLESTLPADHYTIPGWAGRTAADGADRVWTEMECQANLSVLHVYCIYSYLDSMLTLAGRGRVDPLRRQPKNV